MKTRFYLFGLILLVVAAVAFTGCSDDEDAPSKYNAGTWYLVTYDGKTCKTGEYMRFSGDKVYWNKRLNGKNSTYTVEVNGNTFRLVGGETFYVAYYSKSAMGTTSTDGIARTWKR